MDAIDRRTRWFRGLGVEEVDALVVVQGMERGRARDRVVTALTAVTPPFEGQERTLIQRSCVATERGTLVRLTLDPGWRDLVRALADSLLSAGLEGVITAPTTTNVEIEAAVRSRAPVPALGTAFTMASADPEAPQPGRGPTFRWGVSAEDTAQGIEAINAWIEPGTSETMVHREAYPIEVTSADAVDVFAQSMAVIGPGTVSMTRVRAVEEPPKFEAAATFGSFGTGKWMRSLDEGGHLGAVERLTELVVHLAPRLDFAFIRPTYPAQFMNVLLDNPTWNRTRTAWNQHVPDVNGVQLLTRAHIARANDLSRWEVTKVATDRFLVKSRDLEDWYHPMETMSWAADEYPDQAMLSRARNDFGPMILG